MTCAAIEKNAGIHMNPSFGLGSLDSGWGWVNFAVFFRYKFSYFSIIFGVKCVCAGWDESGRLSNTCDLGAQKMLLLSKEKWIANNFPLKVSREKNLDLASRSNVTWFKIW